jgi:hypothetical protein
LWVRYLFIIGFAIPIAVEHLSVTAISGAWVFAKWNNLVDEVVGVTKNDWTQEEVCCNLFKVPSRNDDGAARLFMPVFGSLFIGFKRNNHILGRWNGEVFGQSA